MTNPGLVRRTLAIEVRRPPSRRRARWAHRCPPGRIGAVIRFIPLPLTWKRLARVLWRKGRVHLQWRRHWGRRLVGGLWWWLAGLLGLLLLLLGRGVGGVLLGLVGLGLLGEGGDGVVGILGVAGGGAAVWVARLVLLDGGVARCGEFLGVGEGGL